MGKRILIDGKIFYSKSQAVKYLESKGYPRKKASQMVEQILNDH